MSKVRKWIVFQAIVKSIVQYHVSDSQGKNDGAAGPIENPNQAVQIKTKTMEQPGPMKIQISRMEIQV